MVGRLCLALLALWAASWPLCAEEFRVYTDRPRLLLNAQRMKRLKRDRERQTQRWDQLKTLIEGKARLPEEGFGAALYATVAEDDDKAKQAGQWATTATDVRQIALILDWCRPSLSTAQVKALGDKLKKAAESGPDTVAGWRDRVFAALAIADDSPDTTEKTLRSLVEDWWGKRTAPLLQAGKPVVGRQDLYALLEILHVVRDNLNIDLRESAPRYFKQLTAAQLLTYYPEPFPAPENLYHIPIFALKQEPDLKLASLSRAAELALVAFDSNALESQFLQGWLLDERFTMRGLYGATYEFLWANPYQPGLSYFKFPLSFHDDATGELYVRSSWEDDADWAGLLQGKLQLYREGKRTVIDAGRIDGLLVMGDIMIASNGGGKWRELPKDVKQAYITGLTPRKRYLVEVDLEEALEVQCDPAGTAAFTVDPLPGMGFLIRGPR